MDSQKLINTLEKYAETVGSYRSVIWIARKLIEKGDEEAATKVVREFIEFINWEIEE